MARPAERSGRLWDWQLLSYNDESFLDTSLLPYLNDHSVRGSTILPALLDRLGLWEGEKVLVVSNTSGARLETYVIRGEPGSGTICMNGACAHKIKVEEEIIVMGFELSDRPVEPKSILVDRENKFVRLYSY